MAGIEGLDERFVTTVNLEPYFVDKTDGIKLANGSIEFWTDISRTTPKLVYQLTGSPDEVGGYSYMALPNPVPLSSVGTIQNAGGDNIALYYFPYQGEPGQSTGEIELYYVVVKDSFGVVQFTREAWPSSVLGEDTADENGIQVNQVTNGQFVDFDMFNAGETLTFAYTGSSVNTIAVCADWELVVTHSGAGSITVARTAIAGSANIPTNPPYWLTVTPGTFITSLVLRQRFEHNPGIWYETNDSIDRYINAGILLDANSAADIFLTPSAGFGIYLLSANNTTGAPKYYSDTSKLSLSSNTDSSVAGYLALEVNLSVTNVTRFSSVQLTSSTSSEEVVPYIQDSVNRQQDYTYHYYKNSLAFKPIPSHLTGWDFPLNPAQFAGIGGLVPASGAANTSKYVWDQTILFQSAASGFSILRTTTLGSLQVQCAVDASQFALVQYLPQEKARALLRNFLSVRVSGCTNQVGGLGLTVSLWYTTAANLPVIGSNNSIVLTLDANGKPATFNGTWVEVAPSSSVPKYGVLPFGSDNQGASLDFSYWDAPADTSAASTATFFAIVVGTKAMTVTSVAQFRSISLVPGRIATQPAPQSKDQVLRECLYYYQKSYDATVVPGTITFVGAKAVAMTPGGVLGVSSLQLLAAPFNLEFIGEMIGIPTVTIYAAASGTASAVSARAFYTNTTDTGNVDKTVATYWSTSANNGSQSNKRFVYAISGVSSNLFNVTGANILIAGAIYYHYVADKRLGS